mgnify:CR=1 FL=1|tara:strand:- start:1838 stop:3052 length:1215 start_codon:yes stop_codon:yes gene_type:complete
MSWEQQIKNIAFEITTGDGNVFRPLWKGAEKEKEFNTTKYDFIDVEGSFISRKKSQSYKIPLLFWFQGDDHIEKSNEFEASANDSRAWVLVHPIYGQLKGQPSKIKSSNPNYGVTEFLVEFWESISEDYPESTADINDQVLLKAGKVIDLSSEMYVSDAMPEIADVESIESNTEIVAGRFKPATDLYIEYNSQVTKTLISVGDIVQEKTNAIRDLQTLLFMPSKFNSPVKEVLKNYLEAFNDLLSKDKSSPSDKKLFEALGASMISGICNKSINYTDSDYITREDVLSASRLITTVYDSYTKHLDDIEVSIYDNLNSYSSDGQVQSSILDLVTFTSSSLFELSFQAKQERFHLVEKDTNIIILTHRFLGLDSEDKNLDEFRNINGFRNGKIYEVKKGTEVKYYV